MSQYFAKLYGPFGRHFNVKVDLSNYVTKCDLKNATEFDTPKLVVNFDLASLKADFNKRDVDKLKTAPIDLSKLSHTVKMKLSKRQLVCMINSLEK